MQTEVPIHYLRPNGKEWNPPARIYLDTESTWVETPQGEEHRLRLWSALLIVRRPRKTQQARRVWGRGHTVSDLYAWIEHSLRGIDTCWLWTHNLAFDLAITRLPAVLSEHGWQAQDASVSPGSPWLRMRRGDKRLTMVDSGTWMPRALQEIGARVGVPKLDLPDNDDSDLAWQARCDGDVAILSTAMEQLLDWWERNQLGNWSITGPACGYNAFRHRRDFPTITIDPDPVERKFERGAIYGGRRDAFWIGEIKGRSCSDHDMHGAYPTQALLHPLPVRRNTVLPSWPLDRYRRRPANIGVIADVAVHGAGAHVPVRIDGQVWYPRGTIYTRLASPEIDYLIELGIRVEIGRCAVYRLSNGYSGWARWVLSVADGEASDAPPAAQIAAKHWSRAVIGKFAAHTSEIEKLGASPVSGWELHSGWDADARRSFRQIDVGGQSYAVRTDADAENAFPAVLAFVEAHTRVALDKLLRRAPCRRVLQCDTDGLLVEDDPSADVCSWSKATLGIDLRTKMRVDHVVIRGPQHLIVGSERRLSGIPGNAAEVSPGVYEGRAWPGLTYQLDRGPEAVYHRPNMHVELRGVYTHRWVLEDGSTAAVGAELRGGLTRLLPPQCDPGLRARAPLAATQHPVLAALAGLQPDATTDAQIAFGPPGSVDVPQRGCNASPRPSERLVAPTLARLAALRPPDQPPAWLGDRHGIYESYAREYRTADAERSDAACRAPP